MSDDDEGLPLADAVRVYGDPELWAAYESARSKLNSIPPKPPWIGGSRSDREAWEERYEGVGPAARAAVTAAWLVLESDFKRRLRRGELVAKGTEWPVTVSSRPTIISPQLWDVLALDLDGGAVRAGRLMIVGVRVQTRSQHYAGQASALKPDIVRESPGSEQDAGVRTRGRPSVMGEIAQEMRRRAESDDLKLSLRKEARTLAEWAAQPNRFPEQHVPKPKTIERQLGGLYQELKPIKRSDK